MRQTRAPAGRQQPSFELSGEIRHFREGCRLAFVEASWHGAIVSRARQSFLAEVEMLGLSKTDVDIIAVPGAFEIPLHAQQLARSGRYAGIVGCALVVDGGIYRHDFVAQAVVMGLMQVQLQTNVPVFSVILTPHHFHEQEEHHDFFSRHFDVKGQEAARACAQALSSLQILSQPIHPREKESKSSRTSSGKRIVPLKSS